MIIVNDEKIYTSVLNQNVNNAMKLKKQIDEDTKHLAQINEFIQHITTARVDFLKNESQNN